MTAFLQDLRYGFRVLLKSPGFALVAILALAIGIGANTAIFSVANTLLLQRLPYRDADRLAIVWEHNLVRDRKSNVVGPANFVHWRELNRTFEGLAAVSPTLNVTLTGAGSYTSPGTSSTKPLRRPTRAHSSRSPTTRACSMRARSTRRRTA